MPSPTDTLLSIPLKLASPKCLFGHGRWLQNTCERDSPRLLALRSIKPQTTSEPGTSDFGRNQRTLKISGVSDRLRGSVDRPSFSGSRVRLLSLLLLPHSLSLNLAIGTYKEPCSARKVLTPLPLALSRLHRFFEKVTCQLSPLLLTSTTATLTPSGRSYKIVDRLAVPTQSSISHPGNRGEEKRLARGRRTEVNPDAGISRELPFSLSPDLC